MESLPVSTPQTKQRQYAVAEALDTVRVHSSQLLWRISFLGYSHTMDDYEQRKLRIFNQINFFQLVASLVIPLLGAMLPSRVPLAAWSITAMPAFVSLMVLLLNRFRQYEFSLYAYFILQPLCTCLVYFNGIYPGIELSFLLFVILSVFFVQDRGFMLFVTAFCIMSFFILSVILKHYTYEFESESPVVYLLNISVSLAFIFYGLVLVKKENHVYQSNILSKQKHLTEQNREIEQQKEELTELNAFKSRLFSIISHDLRSPLYALRNLFQNMHRYDPPAEDIKKMVPDVLKDLTYTTSLMENLLQWSKSQMQADAVYPQPVRLGWLAADVSNLLRLQAEAKNIRLQAEPTEAVVLADKDMIHLVLRNLVSNAVKFTPAGGEVRINFKTENGQTRISVQDKGVGISAEALNKIQQRIFYTTTGTGSETGTGLGLLLCHEFLLKNGSSLQIESKEGKGSVFSFALPEANEVEKERLVTGK